MGLGVGVVDGLAVGLGSADVAGADGRLAVDAVARRASAVSVGSANALAAGPPTSAAATSRVPARRSSAPRAVVGWTSVPS